jgi:hypothetical protein
MSTYPDQYCWPHSTAYYSTIGCPGCSREETNRLFYEAASKRGKDWATPNKRLEEKLAIAVEALEKIERVGRVATTSTLRDLLLSICLQADVALAKIRGETE